MARTERYHWLGVVALCLALIALTAGCATPNCDTYDTFECQEDR